MRDMVRRFFPAASMQTNIIPMRRAQSYQHQFTSSDLDQTKQYIGNALKPHALTLLDRTQTLRVKVGRTDFGCMSFMYIHHGADVHVYPGALETIFLFQVPLRAQHQQVRVGGTVIQVTPGIAYVVSPTLEFELRMSRHCDNAVLAVGRAELELHLERLLQRRLDKPLEFSPRVDLAHWAHQELVNLMAHLTRQLNQPSTNLRHELLQSQAESLVMSTMLLNLEHNYRAELLHESAAPKPHYIKKAQAYICENAHLPLTPTDIAQEANVSVRSIYAGFQTYLQTTPMGYVRDVRLDKIRSELQQSDPSSTTIQVVMARYGFTSAGNFSASYRRRFGELPSNTLQRRFR